MAVTKCISDDLAKKILDAFHQLSLLMEQYDGEYDPDIGKYRQKYNEKVGDFLRDFESPTLHIPDEADISLVSIGKYDREDYWCSHTYNFLVDDEHAEEISRIGARALEERGKKSKFFNDIWIDTDDYLILMVYGYALEHDITIYREFHPNYGEKRSRMLYEEFVADFG